MSIALWEITSFSLPVLLYLIIFIAPARSSSVILQPILWIRIIMILYIFAIWYRSFLGYTYGFVSVVVNVKTWMCVWALFFITFGHRFAVRKNLLD
jgi:hypothetical protein